jgi:7-cyano-7-deazaguanine reductase
MNTIETIASKHLGKAGDGSVVNPYITPDFIDASLLVPVPRIYNRLQYKIDESNLPFTGYDVWNCYEFSTLLTSGYPLSGLLKICYPSNSHSIVESKSLKLYLNSFNMVRIASHIQSAKDIIEQTVSSDLSFALGCEVKVTFHRQQSHNYFSPPLPHRFAFADVLVDFQDITFESYNEDPSLLQIIPTNDTGDTRLHTSSLRSNCRVTNQPDWGDVFIIIKGEKTISPESFLKYVISMRKENHFHEEICECIYKRLWDILTPQELFVACLYTRRGGIDINPVRASHIDLITHEALPLIQTEIICDKTLRQ